MLNIIKAQKREKQGDVISLNYVFSESEGGVNKGFFYKSITDPVFNNVSMGQYNWDSGFYLDALKNTGEVWIELGLNKYFGERLNVGFDNEVNIIDCGVFQEKYSFNVEIFYEREKFDTGVIFNRRDNGCIEFFGKDFYSFNCMECSASYLPVSFKVDKNFMIYLDLNNMLKESLKCCLGVKFNS